MIATSAVFFSSCFDRFDGLFYSLATSQNCLNYVILLQITIFNNPVVIVYFLREIVKFDESTCGSHDKVP